MTAPIKMAKRAAAGTLALAVCFTGGVIGAGAATAAPGFTFDQRISGADRTLTAIAASQAAFNDGSDTVIIVERDAVVDGLTASYAAGIADDDEGAPILYVDRQGVPDEVATEIQRLGADNAILVGGTAVLPQAVVTQLESAGLNVTRLSGPDRYATAAAVAQSGDDDPDKVIVASGEVPADALAAGPIAFAKKYPLVLTRPDSVPNSTRGALDNLGSGERLAIGGTVRISASVYDSLGESKRRISGSNRQQTAIALANIATGELGFNTDRVALVSDADRAAVDALVASPVAGKNLAPLLFISGNNIGGDTEQYLRDNAAALTGPGYIFGGTAAVPQSAADQGTTAAGGDDDDDDDNPSNNIGFNITPNDDQTLVIPSGDDDTTDDRTYRVSDLDDSVEYRVTLVRSENINIAADGTVTFKSSADSASASRFSADTGAPASVITVVNGSPVGANTKTSTANSVGGNLSFTIDGNTAESVTPVVYVNGGPGRDADNGGPSIRLETQATAAGTFAESAEKYGLGGKTIYVPVEADSGSAGNDDDTTVKITSVNKSAGYFISGDRTFFYDNNDQLRVNGSPVTLENFNASLSTGDSLRASTYADDASLQSTLNIGDLTPAALTGVAATAVDDTSIRVTWTAPTVSATNPAPTTYTVYRKAGVETARLTDYTKLTDVSPSTTPLELVDKGLTANTQYSYAVTQTVDGDESALATAGESAAAATTNSTGVTAAAQSLNAGVTNDSSFAGTVSAGDVYTIGFNRVLNAPASGAAIRLQDGNGESVDLTNDDNVDNDTDNANQTRFRLNDTTQTFEGKRYAAGTLLTITVGNSVANGVSAIVDRDGNTSNNNGSVDYTAKITGQNGGIAAQVNGRSVAWNPSTSADSDLQTGATAPTTTTDNSTAGPPTISSATFVNATTVTVAVSEAVKGAEGDGSGDGTITASRFAYAGDSNANTATVRASGVALSDDRRTITLTFPAGTVSGTSTTDELRYTPDGSIGDVVDTNENRLAPATPTIANS